MTAIVDPVAAVRAALIADSVVAGLVGTRVYGGEVPERDAKLMPRPCIVLSPSGGFGGHGLHEGFSDYGHSRIDTICHGSTLMEAWEVYLAVYGVLKHLNRRVFNTVLIHSAEALSKGALARDPDTQWPTTLASWRVLASEIAAA